MIQNGSTEFENTLTDSSSTKRIFDRKLSKSNPSFCYFLVESLTRRSKFEIVSPRIRKWKNVFQKDICQWRHCFPCSVTKFGDQNFPCVTAKTSPFSRVGFGWKNCLLTKLQMTYATLSTIEVQLFGKSWKSCRWFIRPESSSSDDVTLLLTCLDLGRAGLKTDVYRICKIIVGFFFFRETRMPRNKIAWSNCCILDLPSFCDTFKHLFSSCLFFPFHAKLHCSTWLCVPMRGRIFLSAPLSKLFRPNILSKGVWPLRSFIETHSQI